MLAPLLAAAGHEVAFSAPFSFSGAPLAWEGFTMLPGGQDPFGSDVIAGHYAWWKADLLLTLCDVFMMDPAPLKSLNVAHWTPVDCDQLGKADALKLRESGGLPVAISRFGERLLREGGFSPRYAPHGIDTRLFRPLRDRDATRAAMGLSPEHFAVGINAANKAGPRKAYPEQMAAFAQFHARHPQARLLVHALIEPKDGVNLRNIAANLGISEACFFPDQYAYVTGQVTAQSVATWSGAVDVLLNATYGEGFGIPVLEAQSAGTPVIVSGFSSMPELLGGGWKVRGQKHWVGGHDAWWQVPFIADVDRALEKAWRAREDGAMPALRDKARAFALRYDTETVFRRHWLPILGYLDEHRIRVLDNPARAKAKKRKAVAGDGRRDLLVIVPSRGRPENVKRLVAAVAETATARTDLMFAFDDDDPQMEASIAAADSGQAGWVTGPRQTLAAWTNELAARDAGKYRYLASLGDDHLPRTPGWDSELLAALDSSGGGFAYPNDLARSDIPEAVVVSSEIVQALGWMCEPSHRHFYVDNVWADLGKGAGCITYLPDVIVEHVHPLRSAEAKPDATYTESASRLAQDEAAYTRWREQRKGADLATIRAVRAARGKPSFRDDYRERAAVWSDIQDHLPFLYATAARQPAVRVLECGVRGGFSTSAFLAAAEKAGGHVWSVDVAEPRVPSRWHASPAWTFTRADDLAFEPPGEVDVLFLDTSHDYGHTLAELEKFVPLVAPGGTVLVHDTRLKAPIEAPPQDPWPAARALDEFCRATGRTWAERGGIYGLGQIDIPEVP